MTEAEQIIAECETRGVVLSVGERSDSLVFDAPAGALSPSLRERLVAHKPEVIDALVEREERAGPMDVEEWVDASLLSRALRQPATAAMLEAFAPLGIAIQSVAPMRERKQEAA